jgi:hypothetical protein
MVNPVAGGIAADWNYALTHAGAQWVTLAHQDDWYAPSYVERCLQAAAGARQPLLVFSSATERAGPRREFRMHTALKRVMCETFFLGRASVASVTQRRLLLSFGDPIPCSSVMLNREAAPDFRFEDGWRTALDWVAWLDLARRPGSFVYVREPLVEWRVHDASATRTHLLARMQEDRRVLEGLWPRPVAAAIAFLYAQGLRRFE